MNDQPTPTAATCALGHWVTLGAALSLLQFAGTAQAVDSASPKAHSASASQP